MVDLAHMMGGAQPLLDHSGEHHALHDRSRLVGPSDRSIVAEGNRVALLVSTHRGHGQYLAGVGHHDDDRAAGRLNLFDPAHQRPLGLKLQGAVDGGVQIDARLCGSDAAKPSGDGAAVVAAFQHHLTGHSAEEPVILVLEAADACLVHVHSPDNGSAQAGPGGIETSRLLQLIHPLQFEFGHRPGDSVGHHPGQIGMLVGLTEQLEQPALLRLQRRGERGRGRRRVAHLAGVGPNRPLRHRYRELHPVAVEDLPPVGRQLDRPGPLLLAVFHIGIRAEELEVGQTNAQPRGNQGERHCHRSAPTTARLGLPNPCGGVQPHPIPPGTSTPARRTPPFPTGTEPQPRCARAPRSEPR